ncbi:hypothetical protein CEUSTIGMA_g6375.t1 [Chlamydomonas eustigma]|uniref:Guanylate cyclase domain-containing protein n=1 Tax=Chlamydomonas eustigma TaxID=1157962 RepID=A0A250X794_9CHLO|nr:hypothetical protein CEUSTIGMA_g6375.t1 [Chlamydomonas eustigma]|eukprot:GAX78935.1 hypothetical protein CEUSTIGMA_g6375.t1 [Chlamydomonas eustigma]
MDKISRKWGYLLNFLFTYLPVFAFASQVLKVRGLQTSAATLQCDEGLQRLALLTLYYSSSGLSWLNSSNWPALPTSAFSSPRALSQYISSTPVSSGSCKTLNTTTGSQINLPDHCCWHGVSCCTSGDCSAVASTTASCQVCSCTVGLVTDIRLGLNQLNGSAVNILSGNISLDGASSSQSGSNNTDQQQLVPVSSALGCSLRVLDVHANSLSGPLPEDTLISQFTKLVELNLAANQISQKIPSSAIGSITSLSYLDLSNNAFTGTVPTSLCQSTGTHASPLTSLRLSNNHLTGSLNLSACNNLMQIVVEGNMFSGAFTSPSDGNNLIAVDLSSSNFSLVSFTPASSNRLAYVDLSYMMGSSGFMNGSQMQSYGSWTSLETLSLQSSLVTGSIPASMFPALETLAKLDLSLNKISGTVPSDIGSAKSLKSLDLSRNYLSGSIPGSITQLLAAPHSMVDLRGNFLSCCALGPLQKQPGGYSSSTAGWYASFNLTARRLPNGLALSSSTALVQMGEESSYRSGQKLLSLLPYGNIRYSGLRCPYILWESDPDEPSYYLSLYLDPEYTLYEGCICDTGFTMIEVLLYPGYYIPQCVPYMGSSTTWWGSKPWLVAIITFFSTLCLGALIWAVIRGKSSSMLHDMNKRAKGPPTNGRISIVVTDIEGFSDLMKSSPELMMSALITHNNLIQNAKFSNYGYTIEQEGDSYTMLFEDPVDAVKFCLQAQQLLAKQKWPDGLFLDEGGEVSSVQKTGGSMIGGLLGKRVHRIIKGGSQKLGGATSPLGGGLDPTGDPSVMTMMQRDVSAQGVGDDRKVRGGVTQAGSTEEGEGTVRGGMRRGFSKDAQGPVVISDASSLMSDGGGGAGGSSIRKSSSTGGLGALGVGSLRGNSATKDGSIMSRMTTTSSYQVIERGSQVLSVSQRLQNMSAAPLHPSQDRSSPGHLSRYGSTGFSLKVEPAAAGNSCTSSGADLSSSGISSIAYIQTSAASAFGADRENNSCRSGNMYENSLKGAANYRRLIGHDMLAAIPEGSFTCKRPSVGKHFSAEGVELSRSGNQAELGEGLHEGIGSAAGPVSEAVESPLSFAQKVEAQSIISDLATSLKKSLKVRMGIATGLLKQGRPAGSCAVLDIAKLVSDAASGGQILMCRDTFMAIKDVTGELGCVTEEGTEVDKLKTSSWWMWKKEEQVKSKEAVLLDMGEYFRLPTGQTIPLILSPRDLKVPDQLLGDEESPNISRGYHDFSRRASRLLTLTSHQVAPQQENITDPTSDHDVESADAAAITQDTKVAVRKEFVKAFKMLRLYQVLAPSLASRARVFGNKVTLKKEWVQIDTPYFDAAGSLFAPLTPLDRIPSSSLGLTRISMVFCMVEGGKAYASRSRGDAQQVIAEIAALMRSLLRQVPGGYFVRQQDGDMKFIVAFNSPEAALYWCLAVQQCMLYIAWPSSAMKHWETEWGDEDELVFRGPRLKMGVCEGTPSSIMPDHMGRADYNGTSINQAARFMDAAAHGGQIACDEKLTVCVLDSYMDQRPGMADWSKTSLSSSSWDLNQFINPSLIPSSVELTRLSLTATGSQPLTATGSQPLTATGSQPLAESSAAPATLLHLEDSAEQQKRIPICPTSEEDDQDPGSKVTTHLTSRSSSFLIGREDSLPRLFNLEERDVELSPDHSPRSSREGLMRELSAPLPVALNIHTAAPASLNLIKAQHRQCQQEESALRGPPTQQRADLCTLGPTQKQEGSVVTDEKPKNLLGGRGISVVMGRQEHHDPEDDDVTLIANKVSLAGQSNGGSLPADGLLSYVHSDSLPKLFNITGESEGYDLTPITHDLQSELSTPEVDVRPVITPAVLHRASSPVITPAVLHRASSPVITHLEAAAASPVNAPLPSRSITVQGDGLVDGSQANDKAHNEMKSVAGSRRRGGGGRTNYATSGSYMLTQHARSMSTNNVHHLSGTGVRRDAASWKLPLDSISEDGATMDVIAMRLGNYKFKGSTEVISMVNFTLAALASRRYPSEPPKGKGGRISDASGLVGCAVVPRLKLIDLYQKQYSLLQPGKGNAVEGGGGLGGMDRSVSPQQHYNAAD